MEAPRHVDAGIGAEHDAGGIQEKQLGAVDSGTDKPVYARWPAGHPGDDVVQRRAAIGKGGALALYQVELAETVKKVGSRPGAIGVGNLVGWSGDGDDRAHGAIQCNLRRWGGRGPCAVEQRKQQGERQRKCGATSSAKRTRMWCHGTHLG